MMITQNDICQLTRAIWESTLGLAVQPIPGPVLAQPEAGIVAARVQITGAWRGAVLLECPKKLARQVARAMFGLDSEEPTSEEIRDALAEITHVTAGNFKSLLCGRCQLSMPQVSERMLDPAIAPEEAVLARLAFDCRGERFVVTILEGQDNARGCVERPEACR